jgi:PKD repeat protein
MKRLLLAILILISLGNCSFSQSPRKIISGEMVQEYTNSNYCFVIGFDDHSDTNSRRISDILEKSEIEYMFEFANSEVVFLKFHQEIAVPRISEILGIIEQKPSVRFLVPALEMNTGDLQGVFDEVIVKLKTLSDYSSLASFASRYSLSVIREDEKIDGVYILQSDSLFGDDLIELSNLLNDQSFTVYAEPNFIVIGHGNTNDSYYSMQWALKNTGQYAGTVGADIDIENAWTITTGSGAIKIAILDCWGSASQLNHPDVNISGTYDATNSGFNSSGFIHDAHGICCAGLIGATRNNNLGITGIAPNCSMLAVKICNIIASNGNWAGSNTQIADGIIWAYSTGAADVISNSNSFGSPSSYVNNAIFLAVNNGRSGKGTPFLSSAGNDNANSIGYPASNSNTIAVGATSNCDERKSVSSCDVVPTWGSNYGTGLDVSAPGTLIIATDIAGNSGYSTGDYYSTFGGTSAACPIAAGVMGLLLSENSNLTQAQARLLLESSCDKVGGYSYNGGVSGQPNGTWSTNLGYGRINAFAALSAIQSAPSNDHCSGAIYLPINSTCIVTQGSNMGADESLSLADVSCDAPGNVDVWYKLTVPSNGSFSVFTNSLTNSNMDLGLAIYAGSCSSLSEIACVQNGNGSMPAGNISLPAQYWNTDVYLRLQEYGSIVNAGTFEICLYSTGVNQAPIADFSVSNQNPQLNSTVQFTDLSSNNPTAWNWTITPSTYYFVNGTYQNSQNPQVQFTSSGSYTIQLQAQNPYGYDNETKTNYVIVSNSGNPPSAEFTAGNTSIQINQSVSFFDQSSNSPTNWQWTFNPSSVQYLAGTSSTSQNPVVQFNSTGSYDVELEASNTFGNDTEYKNNYVLVSSGGSAPIAEFISNRNLVQVNDLVQFNDLSIGNVTNWSWSFTPGTVTFEGGTTPNSSSIVVKFLNPGSYTVQLTVQNGIGSDIEVKQNYITVYSQVPMLQFVTQFPTAGTVYKIGQTNDGGYFMCGRRNDFGNGSDFFLIKLDDHGNLIWDRVLGTNVDDESWGGIQLSGGGFLLWGVTDDTPNPNGAGLLIMTDANGNVVWSKITNTSGSDYFTAAYEVSNGDIYVASIKSIYKISSSGSILWSRYFSNISNFLNMFVLANGEIFITGYGGGLDFQLARIDASGGLIFAKEVGITGLSGFFYLHTAATTSDGGAIILLIRDDFPDEDAIVIKTNSSGDVQWSRRIGNPIAENFFDVIETSDGGYLVSGRSHEFSGNGILIKLYSNGQTQWSKVYDQQQFKTVIETIDNGFAIGGLYNADPAIIKTDETGTINCGENSFAISNSSVSTQQSSFTFTNSNATPLLSTNSNQSSGIGMSLACNNFSPVANFIASNLQPNVGDMVLLIDQSLNFPTVWNWYIYPLSYQYGNMTNGGTQSPYIIFNAPGLYTITQTVSNQYGADQIIKSNYINVLPSVGLSKGHVLGPTIFPNPNDGHFLISTLSAGTFKVEIFDLTGRLFSEQIRSIGSLNETIQVHCESLPSNIYCVRISSGDFVHNAKFIKK